MDNPTEVGFIAMISSAPSAPIAPSAFQVRVITDCSEARSRYD